VINGRLLDGIGGTTGEWGHGPASTARTGASLPQVRCQCGKLYAQISSSQLDCERVIDAWENGDEAATQTIDVWLDIVGGALANIVNFLGPSIVVVGGGLANAQN